jgi:hypothetical protein
MGCGCMHALTHRLQLAGIAGNISKEVDNAVNDASPACTCPPLHCSRPLMLTRVRRNGCAPAASPPVLPHVDHAADGRIYVSLQSRVFLIPWTAPENTVCILSVPSARPECRARIPSLLYPLAVIYIRCAHACRAGDGDLMGHLKQGDSGVGRGPWNLCFGAAARRATHVTVFLMVASPLL